MKKALIVTTLGKKLNFGHLYMIMPLMDMGYSVYWAANFKNVSQNDYDDNIKYFHLSFNRNPFNWGNVKAYFQLKKIITTNNFEIIHCNTPIASFFTRIAALNVKSTIIYTAHGFHFFKGSGIMGLIFRLIENYLSKYTDIIITMNNEDYKASLCFKTKAKKYLIPGVGINTEMIENKESCESIRKTLDISKNDLVLTTVGELNKNKNQIVILKAMSKINKDNIHLIICGIGNQEQKLKKFARKNHLMKYTHFLGFRSDVAKILEETDIFILMSKREGLPRSIQEAMNAGLPCIVSDTRGSRDLIRNKKGGYVIMNNEIQLSKAIEDLQKNENLRLQFGSYNRIFVRKYDFHNVVKMMRYIYEEK